MLSKVDAMHLVSTHYVCVLACLLEKTEEEKEKKEVTFDENQVEEENPISGKVENFLGNDQVEEKIQSVMENVEDNEAAAAQRNPISGKVENFLGDDQVCEKIEEKMQALMENVEENEAAVSEKVTNFLGNDQVGEKIEEKMQALMENDAAVSGK
ncbi:hypothetical protein Q3G72_032114 [Acer saccharum]|nr:hypothetical protein Q3G72_032114 [Acer saccharum]